MPTTGWKKIQVVVKVASWQSSRRHFGRRFGNRGVLGEVPYDFALRVPAKGLRDRYITLFLILCPCAWKLQIWYHRWLSKFKEMERYFKKSQEGRSLNYVICTDYSVVISGKLALHFQSFFVFSLRFYSDLNYIEKQFACRFLNLLFSINTSLINLMQRSIQQFDK